METKNHTSSAQAEQRFIEMLGHLAEADGLPRLTGQVWALLVLSEEPVSSGDIADRLKISRGSVSTNTRLLETIGMAERRSKPGERQTYYAMRDEPYSEFAEQAAERSAANAHKVRKVAETLDRGVVGERLQNLVTFYEAMADCMRGTAQQFANDSSSPRKAEIHEKI